jgi:hypothetical protein
MKTPNRFVTVLALAATVGSLVAATFPQYQTLALIAGTIAAVATALGRSLFPDHFPPAEKEKPTTPGETAGRVIDQVILRGRKRD